MTREIRNKDKNVLKYTFLNFSKIFNLVIDAKDSLLMIYEIILALKNY
jgi:hypothetical protein